MDISREDFEAAVDCASDELKDFAFQYLESLSPKPDKYRAVSQMIEEYVRRFALELSRQLSPGCCTEPEESEEA